MNEGHLKFLASPEWARLLETHLLPWIRETDLGDDVLEVGPGPGLTTDLLRGLAPRVTAVELDDALARALAERLQGTNVDVVHADATEMPFEADRFSAATCFSMLHHVPAAEIQDRVFAELCRVLRPRATLLIVDALDIDAIRQGHVDDTFVPVDPTSVRARLETAGFASSVVEVSDYEFRVRALKP